MKNVMGIIYTGEKDSFLRELTTLRAIAAVPIAGRYRLIDFMLSGMVNSGMKNVSVIMQRNYHSLMDHLGSGKEWDLHGKNDGLYILPPFLTHDNVGVYNGSLDALHSNLNYLHRSKQEYVLLCNSLIFFNPKFNEMFDAYRKSKCDVMMLYTREKEMLRPEYGFYLGVDEHENITEIEVDPTNPHYECTSMDAMILRKDLLIDLVDRGVSHGYHDLVKDVLQKYVRDAGLKVMGYEYKDYCRRMDSIVSYFQTNLDMLDPQIRHKVFLEERPVFTKVRDEMPARYLDEAVVIDSVVADGSVVNGQLDHCVLFRGVRIEKGADLKNCVLMQDAHIGEGAQLENCILDKQATIKPGTRLIGPAGYPIVISKNMTI